MRVSTVLPAYNAERTIGQAIDSALSQAFEGHEVIVINDGSTDSTGAILEKYGNRVQVITQRNRGVSVARNAGIGRSTGKYLAFLDNDDLWLPGKLVTMVQALERNPRASLAFSEYRNIDESGTDIGASTLGHAPSMEEMTTQPLPAIMPSTWLTPRQLFVDIGGFCEAFDGAGAFSDCWILLLLRELGEFVYVSEELALYRVGNGGALGDKYAAGLRVFISLVRARYGAGGETLIRHAKVGQCRRLL